MIDSTVLPIQFTEIATRKIKSFLSDKSNQKMRFRIYIFGGGCNGFQYGFTFDYHVNDDDITMERQGIMLIIDSMSLQYLIGSSIDYIEELEGSRFVVTNPNAKNTCGCGASFSV